MIVYKKNMYKKYLEESINIQKQIMYDDSFWRQISRTISLISKCFKNGKKLLIAGNGGSAADAQHFAAEFIGRYKLTREPYPAIALTVDTSVITAWCNDFDFKTLFSRQIKALGKKGDIFVGISTSGNSQNILEGILAAKEKKIKTIALLGSNGGKIKNLADINIIIPSGNTPRIQEVHTLLIHIICEQVEIKLAK